MMRDMARQFTLEEVLPAANRLDPVKGDMPRELIDRMGELGFFGILIPEEYGGLGLGAFEYCLVAEELARGWMSVASIIARGNSFYRSVPGEGRERRRRIEAMAQGAVLLAPRRCRSLSRFGPLRRHLPRPARRRRVGDHRLQILVHLRRRCDFISVLCRDRRPAGASGKGASTVSVSVEKPQGELPKGCSGAPIPKIGYFGWKTWELHFDAVRAPARVGRGAATRRPGGRCRGSRSAWAWPAPTPPPARSAWRGGRWRTPSPTPGSGASSASRSPTSRPSASRSPTMATEIEAARQLIYYCCSEIDAGRAGRGETSMAKLFASEMAERVTSEAPADLRRRRLHHALPRRTLLARRQADQDLRGHARRSSNASSPTPCWASRRSAARTDSCHK